jgi:SAM-dependent methyltransferase
MNPSEFANIAKSEQNFWWYRGMRQILFGMLDPLVVKRHLSRVLDAGCGTGYFAKLLEQRYETPTFAIDSAWPALQYARKMNVRRTAQCDIRELPFQTGSFDLVLSMDVIVHLLPGEDLRAFGELARVTARGGLVAVRASAMEILHSRHSDFVLERQRYTKARLVEAVEAQGVLVLRCTYANCFLTPLALAKFRVWEPLTRQPIASGLAPLPDWIDRTLHASLALEAKLLKSGWTLPFGQSLILIAEKT